MNGAGQPQEGGGGPALPVRSDVSRGLRGPGRWR